MLSRYASPRRADREPGPPGSREAWRARGPRLYRGGPMWTGGAARRMSPRGAIAGSSDRLRRHGQEEDNNSQDEVSEHEEDGDAPQNGRTPEEGARAGQAFAPGADRADHTGIPGGHISRRRRDL